MTPQHTLRSPSPPAPPPSLPPPQMPTPPPPSHPPTRAPTAQMCGFGHRAPPTASWGGTGWGSPTIGPGCGGRRGGWRWPSWRKRRSPGGWPSRSRAVNKGRKEGEG
eukprot:scaffold16045_cov110-Isochrysis_galbana.AAC.13